MPKTATSRNWIHIQFKESRSELANIKLIKSVSIYSHRLRNQLPVELCGRELTDAQQHPLLQSFVLSLWIFSLKRYCSTHTKHVFNQMDIGHYSINNKKTVAPPQSQSKVQEICKIHLQITSNTDAAPSPKDHHSTLADLQVISSLVAFVYKGI